MEFNVIPKPQTILPGEGFFQIGPGTRIFVTPEALNIGEYLQAVLHLPLEVTQAPGKFPGSIFLTTQAADLATGKEGYRLDVSTDAIEACAPQAAGLFYAAQTLRQMLPVSGPAAVPAVKIEDWPRFAWRGLMLDVCRHIFPVDFIMRLIDVMALHKMNVLHWHLTEDQGWRIEINRYPRLTEIGSKRDSSPVLADRKTLDGIPYSGFYTQEQVAQVIAYAASRYITVVPEIEMPGHAMAALASYPELGCTGGPYKVRTFWGVEEDVFCAGNEQVYTFIENVLDEVLALFPSEFIHIGGDECPKTRWEKCPKCQETIRQNGLKDEHDLQSFFIRRVEKYLTARGRRLIGWDEILEGGLAPNATVMSWRGVKGGIQAAKEGHDIVMTPNTHCYLDYYQAEDRESEPPAIGGYVPLERVYTFDPVLPEFTSKEAAHVLGGQGNLWTEYIPTPEQAGYMLFPRASALAEALWSSPETRDFADFRKRLDGFLPILKQMGMNYRNPGAK
jgi:hexosaminidase